MPPQLQSGLGLLVLLVLAWSLSEQRRLVSIKFIASATALQFVLAVAFLKVPWTTALFAELNRAIFALDAASQAGSAFVFGFLGGGPLPYEETRVGSSIVFAFRFLPLVIFISALAALLTYWRVLPAIVRGFAWLFERSLRVGGAVAVSSAANIFLGTIEAPILIRPYIEKLTRSELYVVMCTGMAGIAGTVLILFASMLAGKVPNVAGHLLVASVLTVPAAILFARILIPETATPTPGNLALPKDVHGSIDALAHGTRQGLEMFLNILATLLVFVALVHLCNAILGLLPDFAGATLSLERIFGWLFSPIAWLIGIPWHEAPTVGSLLGIKTTLNELLAYIQLSELSAGTLSERSQLLTTYALCGFANFGSVGIMIAGLSSMAPKRRAEITRLGMHSLIGGTLATCATAALVGVLV
ncbi:MAG: nucleoside:proton symporter [Candidatus Obscuribacterales bacterium]|nr:nucleoside:proton symporter [Steroidobacteraceae bacterium]